MIVYILNNVLVNYKEKLVDAYQSLRLQFQVGEARIPGEDTNVKLLRV